MKRQEKSTCWKGIESFFTTLVLTFESINSFQRRMISKPQISFYTRKFEDLTLKELHDIFALRSEVFVVEQDCVYQDIDGKDFDALHLYIKDEKDSLLAYTRVFEKDAYHKGFVSIGRVVVSPKARGQALGKTIMQYSIDECQKHYGSEAIKISAQKYLDKFYTELGFKATGKEYLEDGIPHMEMILNL